MARRASWYRRLAILAAVMIGGTTLMGGGPAYAEDRIERFEVANRREDQVEPRVSGNWVVWKDYRNYPQRAVDDSPNGQIYAMDLENSSEVQVSHSGQTGQPAISGTLVVWTDGSDKTTEIHGVDLNDGQIFAVTSAPGRQEHPAISGTLIVWQDNRKGNWDIFARDLNNNGDFTLVENSEDQERPAVSGRTVVWEDRRDRGSGPDIYGMNVDESRQPFRITREHDAYEPALSGPWVVWVGHVDQAVFAKNLKEDRQIRLSSAPGLKSHPAISGNTVVWTDERDGGRDIFGYDLKKAREFVVARESGDQDEPDVDGDSIVWSDGRGNNRDVYAALLNGTKPKPAPASPTASPDGVAAAQPSPPPDPLTQQVKVANSGGSNVNLRSAPGLSGSRIRSYPEGTTLTAFGETRQADGLPWRNVRDSQGTEGWMDAELLAPT